MTKRVIGVMGASESDGLTDADKARLKQLAEKLGGAIAKHDCILISGATTGLPDLISRAAREHGGFAVGISPAENRREHIERYKMPPDAADVIIYTGLVSRDAMSSTCARPISSSSSAAQPAL